MPILYRTNCHEKSLVFAAFDPFVHPEKIEGIIIGNDLDSLLSAALLKTRFGWDVVGFYDYTSIWSRTFGMPDFVGNLLSGKYVAVDLDIFHPAIPSIGHHILEFQPDESGKGFPEQQYSLNPNFIRGIDLMTYRRKYPLGTIHFLSWLLGIEPVTDEAELLMWLADSSFINGQRFNPNVSEWIGGFFHSAGFQKVFQEVDTLAFETQLRNRILSKLEKIVGRTQNGQTRSRHLNITGFQCKWQDANAERETIGKVLEFIREITGWKTPNLPRQFRRITGKRISCRIDEIRKSFSSLESFLRKRSVFSYVIPSQRTLNYTIHLVLEK
ncbi:MAG: hypothetical protein COT43_10560 [Candidatus Marinimicrobia bacterium CG08_land_8_20_14_0_20_45_22]|nr:MAG: hypothetical protein COT43_10560 [Candidatus Marinimicrobia bacterium CG08_land_8_20_14_0_20_45_22]